MAAVPRVGERFTEFCILGAGGKAEEYPTEVVLGEEAEVIVGILNREHEEVSYRLEIQIDGVVSDETWRLVLAHNEKWEQRVNFKPTKAGDNQRVEFLLYKQMQDEPSLKLQLQIDVKGGQSSG